MEEISTRCWSRVPERWWEPPSMPGTSIRTCAGRTTAGSHPALGRRHQPPGAPNPELLGAELPEPAQHVNGVEKPVSQLDTPGISIPGSARPYLAQQPPGQVAG